MSGTQRQADLEAIAEHLDTSGARAVPAQNVPLLREVDAAERMRRVEDLKDHGLITIHRGALNGIGRPSLHLELTAEGKATIHHPAEPDTTRSELRDRWHDRDLPVLTALAQAEDQGTELPTSTLTAATGLHGDIRAAVDRLIDTGYVARADFDWDNEGVFFHIRLTEKGLRTVGIWPSPETAADRLLAALEHLAQHGPDEPTRSKGKAALAQLGGLGRDTLAGVATAVLTGAIPTL